MRADTGGQSLALSLSQFFARARTRRELAVRIRSCIVPAVSRHSIRQAKRDDLAFPVRVKVRVPVEGLGSLLDDMQSWLNENVGAVDHACHNQPGLACSTAAFYFRDTEAATAFVRAFPGAELADGLASPAYRSERRN